MDFRLIHLYPDLMSLYGSYANVAVLRQYLQELGNTVTVETIRPGQEADLSGCDFLYMGAGTERSQKAALADFLRFGETVKAAAAEGTVLLFAGTAMELLGSAITDSAGTVYPAIGLADFTSAQGKKRFVGDVYGKTPLYQDAVVGFMNKCTVLTGVETPLLTSCDMGFGNACEGGPEGFFHGSVFASELTGPILVKNPRLLERVAAAVYAHQGQTLPEKLPLWPYAEEGYAITSQQLLARAQQGSGD